MVEEALVFDEELVVLELASLPAKHYLGMRAKSWDSHSCMATVAAVLK